MYIEELKEGDSDGGDSVFFGGGNVSEAVVLDAKRVLVGAGARALFYPTLVYNVVRNKIQSEFRWWDRVDEFILLGAVPFPTDVINLKQLGVSGVVTLNEPFETLVPTELYKAHNIDHLVIPTRDYLFAPSYDDICEAVEFINGNASSGKTTYVHCKAGRGRSTTIVLCYLVEHKQMTPDTAFQYVKSTRPRVRLASAQWQAVQDYYHRKVCKLEVGTYTEKSSMSPLGFVEKSVSLPFDEGSIVLVTQSDLDGYDESFDSCLVGRNILAELGMACRAQFASQAAIARISCLWLRGQKVLRKQMVTTDQLGNVTVDIRVY